jgi:Dyp-type peroxidase family
VAASVTVRLDLVQGIILRGYEDLEASRWLLLQIDDAAAARGWLAGLLERQGITPASTRPDGVEVNVAVNIAFTFAGLKLLGLPDEADEGFSREFQEGMDTDHRRRVLGDTVPGRKPDQWDWGNRGDTGLHILLLLYAADQARLEQLYQDHKGPLEAARLTERRRFDSIRLVDRKEHFGFRDGISQPALEGVYKKEKRGGISQPTVDGVDMGVPYPGEAPVPSNTIQPGEILLGYPNEYGKLPLSPGVRTRMAPGREELVDFGRNGSYLVFRQLSQKVREFWQFIDAAVRRSDQGPAELAERAEARRRLASKMVGRWPGGAPLALRPEADDPALKDENDFTFTPNEDASGLRTPIGAHTRRSNPRDALEPGAKGRLSPEESLAVTKKHRIIRRGRQYGQPVAQSMAPDDILAAPEPAGAPPGEDRGLLFLCFNANIARQFEFIQQTWVDNPKFGSLYGDSDPLLGLRQPTGLNQSADVFTVQAAPARERHTSLADFVRVRGGGYFFMPGLEALRYLAGLDAHLEPLDPLARESIPPDEDVFTKRLTALLKDKVTRDYPAGTSTRRDAHAKHHGCVKAEFIVEPDLDPELRVGVFRRPRTYQAWVRFSNQDGVPRPDAQKDIRGMAIKLMGVEGEKLLEDEKAEQTQDFLLISHPVFVTQDVAEFYHLIQGMTRGTLGLGWFFFNPFNPHPRAFRNLMGSLQRHASLLEIRYWSTTPYHFGARAVKYSARPQTAGTAVVPPNPSPDFLKDQLRQSLAKGEARFDFLVQFQTDPDRMPVEDPGVLWPEDLSPFRKVATVRIPAQEFDSAEQMAFAENLSFTPWHSLPDHRPLGGINRARRFVYRVISEFRHQRNGTPRREPKSWDDLLLA